MSGWSRVLARALDHWRKTSQRKAAVRHLQSLNPHLLQDVGIEPHRVDEVVETRTDGQGTTQAPFVPTTRAVGRSRRGPFKHGPE